MKGQEKLMVNILKFVVIMAVVVLMLLTTLKGHLDFVSDVKMIGGESYNRFTLTEKILNAEGCTKSRGVFYLDEVRETDDNGHFKGCEVPIYAEWSYSISSEEINLEGRKDPEKKIFDTAQGIPVVFFDEEKEKYYPGKILVYGKNTIYTPRTGTESFSDILTAELKRENFEGENPAESSTKFECDFSDDTKCKLLSIETISNLEPEGRERFVFAEITVDGDSKETEVKSLSDAGEESSKKRFSKWSAKAPLETELSGGETVEINAGWKSTIEHHEVTQIDTYIRYQVICEEGKIYTNSGCVKR